MSGDAIVFRGVSKFYGEVLGVDRVDLELTPGLTSLVGPNGSGKTTLMNLLTGLVRPTRGRCEVLGIGPDEPERLFRAVGYAPQWDAFPRGTTARGLLETALRLHGAGAGAAARRAGELLDTAGLAAAADRRAAGFSKGMRQRLKLVWALAHRPRVVVLDEPLNGLDPVGRSEVLELLRRQAAQGAHVVLSSHVLHEVDLISDRVVLLDGGRVVAEGSIREVRSEMEGHPLQVQVRCGDPQRLAAALFGEAHVTEVRIHEDRGGLSARTRDADRFHLLLNRVAGRDGIGIEAVRPEDEDVESVYHYLIGGGATGGGGG